ncbi:hypothetical protein C0431_09675 [bacterium]|jgi:hypothetical protein|nr:hypothetical protein [bacterium]
MHLPVIVGQLDRRILLNYHFSPDLMSGFLPAPFEPRLHNGRGVGGICMIRFKQLRPRRFPGTLGINSENAAHRIAVQWRERGEHREGVFIPRRDTASAFNRWAGGRIFPGVFQIAQFAIDESQDHYHIEIADVGQPAHVIFDGNDTNDFSPHSIFTSLDEASDFFAKGAVGYSASRDGSHFQGMELRLLDWHISPLKINKAYVRLFEDGVTFPQGSVILDSAMVMRRLRHEWHNIRTIPS